MDPKFNLAFSDRFFQGPTLTSDSAKPSMRHLAVLALDQTRQEGSTWILSSRMVSNQVTQSYLARSCLNKRSWQETTSGAPSIHNRGTIEDVATRTSLPRSTSRSWTRTRVRPRASTLSKLTASQIWRFTMRSNAQTIACKKGWHLVQRIRFMHSRKNWTN